MYKIELACYCEYVHQEMEIVTGFTTKGCNAIGYHPTRFSQFFHCCLFSQKGKFLGLPHYLFILFFVSILFLLCWESLLFSFLNFAPIHFLTPQHLHLNHHVPPPPPLCNQRWARHAWPFWLMQRWQITSCQCRIAQPTLRGVR